MWSRKIIIINLDTAPERYAETIAALQHETGVDVKNIRRFNAKRADYEAERLTSVCRILCPAKTLGCALSHREVAKEALRRDESFPILVLEDDTFPAQPRTLLTDLECEVARDDDWDIILLNTVNIISEPPAGAPSSATSGSTAAYLLSKTGAIKLSNSVIPWHADLMRNSHQFSVIQGPELFKTRDLTPTGVTLGGRDIVWIAKQPCFRLRLSSCDCEILGWHVFIVILVFITAFLLSIHKTKGSAVKLISANITGLVLATAGSWGWYVTQDSNYARLSPSTARIAAVGAILSVTIASRTLWMGCGASALSALVLLSGYASLVTVLLWRDEDNCRVAPPVYFRILTEEESV